jgi:hypothetical protein
MLLSCLLRSNLYVFHILGEIANFALHIQCTKHRHVVYDANIPTDCTNKVIVVMVRLYEDHLLISFVLCFNQGKHFVNRENSWINQGIKFSILAGCPDI